MHDNWFFCSFVLEMSSTESKKFQQKFFLGKIRLQYNFDNHDDDSDGNNNFDNNNSNNDNNFDNNNNDNNFSNFIRKKTNFWSCSFLLISTAVIFLVLLIVGNFYSCHFFGLAHRWKFRSC